MSERITSEGQQSEPASAGAEPREIDLLRQAANMIESEDLSKWSSAHDRVLLQLIKEAIRDHEQGAVEPAAAMAPTTENLLAAIYSVARSIGHQCVANMELALYKSMAQTAGGRR